MAYNNIKDSNNSHNRNLHVDDDDDSCVVDDVFSFLDEDRYFDSNYYSDEDSDFDSDYTDKNSNYTDKNSNYTEEQIERSIIRKILNKHSHIVRLALYPDLAANTFLIMCYESKSNGPNFKASISSRFRIHKTKSNEYPLCTLSRNYIDSSLFFTILCQSINPKEIQTYNFETNRLLSLKLHEALNNKITPEVTSKVISYL
jgi:hypothetical protein